MEGETTTNVLTEAPDDRRLGKCRLAAPPPLCADFDSHAERVFLETPPWGRLGDEEGAAEPRVRARGQRPVGRAGRGRQLP